MLYTKRNMEKKDHNTEKKVILELRNISKHFHDATGTFSVLNNLNAVIYEGEKVAIIGPSGSGKSTLLSLLAGLDTPSSGEILSAGRSMSKLSEKDMARYRNETIGIIFQSFELVSPFTVKENVEIPLLISGTDDPSRIESLIARVGLSERKDFFPRTLSGGEKQRTAIARALANNPTIILADEPTGSLDSVTGGNVLDLLFEEIDREKKTFIIITHDSRIANTMDRIFELKDATLHEKF